MIEYGIEWRYKADTSAGHTSGGYTLAGARSQVKNAGDPKKFHPYAARVVERDVSDWREVETPAAQGDSVSVASPKTERARVESRGQIETAPALRQQRSPGPNRYEGAADD